MLWLPFESLAHRFEGSWLASGSPANVPGKASPLQGLTLRLQRAEDGGHKPALLVQKP